MTDRRKECLTEQELKDALGPVGLVFSSLMPEYIERSGKDRRQEDWLGEALRAIECPKHHQAKTWETPEKHAIRLIIKTIDRRK